MSLFSDLIGTTKSVFQLAIGGVKLKNVTGNLSIRNAADSADASVTTSQLNNSGDTVVINSDAAETGADWKLSLVRPVTGMTADESFTFPVDGGSAGQVLSTDGTGITSWVSAGSTAACLTQDTTSVAFGSSSSITAFTLPANAVVDNVQMIVDTAFDGTPSLSVGISGTTSKYMGSGDNDLKGVATTVYQTHPGLVADGSSESIVITYSAGSATVGAARVIVSYSVPS